MSRHLVRFNLVSLKPLLSLYRGVHLGARTDVGSNQGMHTNRWGRVHLLEVEEWEWRKHFAQMLKSYKCIICYNALLYIMYNDILFYII